jgi:hypothetical protein
MSTVSPGLGRQTRLTMREAVRPLTIMAAAWLSEMLSGNGTSRAAGMLRCSA